LVTGTAVAREKVMALSHSKEDLDQAVGKAQVRGKVVLSNRLLGEYAITSLTSHLELQSALKAQCCEECRLSGDTPLLYRPHFPYF